MTPQSGGGGDGGDGGGGGGQAMMMGLGLVSSLIGGLGKIQSGRQQEAAYDYNADIAIQNMQQRMAANQEQYSVLVGRQASSYAASGVDIRSGSPLLIMAATAARGAVAGKQIEEAGTEEAALQRYYGKIAAFQGTMGGIGTFLSGITQAAGSYYGNFAKQPSPTGGGGGGGDWVMGDT